MKPNIGEPTLRLVAAMLGFRQIVHILDSLFVVDIATDYNNNGFQVYSDCLFTAHTGLTNYLFVDGHAKALKPTATYQGDTVNYWYRDATSLGVEARTTLAKAEARKD